MPNALRQTAWCFLHPKGLRIVPACMLACLCVSVSLFVSLFVALRCPKGLSPCRGHPIFFSQAHFGLGMPESRNLSGFALRDRLGRGQGADMNCADVG